LQEQEIYFVQIVQTSAGAQATSDSQCTGSSFPRVKQLRRAVDCLLHLVQSLRMSGNIFFSTPLLAAERDSFYENKLR